MESANAPSVHGKRKLRSRIWARQYCYLMLIPVAAYFIIWLILWKKYRKAAREMNELLKSRSDSNTKNK